MEQSDNTISKIIEVAGDILKETGKQGATTRMRKAMKQAEIISETLTAAKDTLNEVMKHCEIICMILASMQKALANDTAFDTEANMNELNLSRSAYGMYLEMMQDSGMIKGLSENDTPRITIHGLEYLMNYPAIKAKCRAMNEFADLTDLGE